MGTVSKPLRVSFTGIRREEFFKLAFHTLKVLAVCRAFAIYSDVWPLFGILRIYLEPLFKIRAWLCVRFDRIGRAFGFTHATVNTLVWMDNQHVFTLVETINRANFNAIHIFALNAFIVDDIGHFTLQGGMAILFQRGSIPVLQLRYKRRNNPPSKVIGMAFQTSANW